MILTVNNFKSIHLLNGFRLAPLTILAGANSSGKSSLTQVLLLLKQTIESNSKDVLVLADKYFEAESLKDIVFRNGSEVRFRLEFTNSDMAIADMFGQYVSGEVSVSSVALDVTFRINGTVRPIQIVLDLKADTDYQLKIEIQPNKHDYYKVSLSHQTLLHYSDKRLKKEFASCSLELTNFLPFYLIRETKAEGRQVILLDIMKTMMTALKEYFGKVFYISPNRVSPVLAQAYDQTPSQTVVSPDGSNTRYILYSNKQVKEEVSNWICSNLHLASAMNNITQDANKRYHSKLQDRNRQTVDLCQMGYGVSQILPIITQGILLPPGGTLIVEDPEAHIHPAVQADLVDFFLYMAKSGKHVIVETHSDHIITRIRRRVAEQLADKDMVSLVFVENNNNGSDYIKYELDEAGVFKDKLPDGFLNVQDKDFRAIITSKLNKK